jgi:hypothetical protein
VTALNDVELLRRRIDTLVRAASDLRRHAADLHGLGWEKAVADVEKVNGGSADHSPRAGDPRARRLFERIFNEVAQMESELVGLDRSMTALFYAGSSSPEPSRGSTISIAEHDRLLANQRRRSDTPARLVDQPSHPGRRS